MDCQSPKFAQYREEILALLPIDTVEKSGKLVEVWQKYYCVDIWSGKKIKK